MIELKFFSSLMGVMMPVRLISTGKKGLLEHNSIREGHSKNSVNLQD
jgi:hypothetical protein